MSAAIRDKLVALDLLEQYVYYGEHGGVELADRFLQSAEDTFGFLAANPGVGRPYAEQIESLGEVRVYPVRSGFERVLILYSGDRTGVRILRVVHAARNLAGLLKPAVKPRLRDS